MEKIYVDTNVFVSYLRGEYGKKLIVNQEHEAEKLFDRTINCEFTIYISELVLDELLDVTKLSQESIDRLLKKFNDIGKLGILNATSATNQRALEFSSRYGTHFKDAVHAAYCERANAVLVTWNVKDFLNIKEIETYRPNEL